MKAVVYTKYGAPDVLHLEEIEKPVPQDNEILVKIRATTVNYGDLLARNFSSISLREFNMPTPLWLPVRLSFGWSKPKNPILGSEFATRVTEDNARQNALDDIARQVEMQLNLFFKREPNLPPAKAPLKFNISGY